jgi:hypothetical protein
VILNSIFGFGGKVDRRGFETCSSHLSPRNEPMNTSFEIHIANTYGYHMDALLLHFDPPQTTHKKKVTVIGQDRLGICEGFVHPLLSCRLLRAILACVGNHIGMSFSFLVRFMLLKFLNVRAKWSVSRSAYI